MSEEQATEQAPTASDKTKADPGQNEDSDNMNLFASVWVKIEVNEDDDEDDQMKIEGIKEEPLNPLVNQTQRKPKRRPQPKNLKCEQCDYKTNHKNCLAIHILGHTNSKPLTCDQCDYKTRYPVSLKRHIFMRHECEDLEAKKQGLPTYNCSVCSYQTHFKWNLSSHQRKHNLAKQFKCPHCNYSTAYKHNHIKHSRTHDKPVASTYYCDKCPFATKYEGHITRHLAKVHFEISDKASRCDHCSFSSKTKWRLNIHKNRSRQDKPIKCAHCEYQSFYRCAYREHKQTHSEISHNNSNQHWLTTLLTNDTNVQVQNVQDFESTKEEQAQEIIKMCEVRSKIDDGTNNGTKIYEELKSKLNEDPIYYTINDANKTMNSESSLNISHQSEHEKNNHYLVDPTCDVQWSNIRVNESPDQDRPFQCISCNYQAKFKASVQRHYQRHHTSHNRPYKCVKCDFSTKTKDQIALHNKRSKSDEILTCKICDFTTVFKCQFAMHEKAHYPFKCVYCDYTCKKKYDIQKHFTIVHLGNGLKCSYCDFKATRKDSLLCHEAIHTGDKPFQCQLCDYKSVRRHLLENHLIRFHKMKGTEKIIDDSKIESLKRNDSGLESENAELRRAKINSYYYTTAQLAQAPLQANINSCQN